MLLFKALIKGSVYLHYSANNGSIQTSITETALLLQFEGGNYMRAAFDRRSTVYHQRYTFRRDESNKTVSQQALVLSLSIADTIEFRAWFI